MAYQVALLNFEGPLDLLLQLVEQTRMAVSELPLTQITEQYLEYTWALTDLDPFEASQFAEVAAKLLYIKSVGLISDGANEEEQGEMAELQEQLDRYGACKQAGDQLAALWVQPAQSWSRARTEQSRMAALPPNLTVAGLRQALAAGRARQAAGRSHRVAAATVSLAGMQQRLRQAMQDNTPTLQLFFGRLNSRTEVAVAFAAALELWRRGELTLTQRRQFGSIEVAHATPHPTT